MNNEIKAILEPRDEAELEQNRKDFQAQAQAQADRQLAKDAVLAKLGLTADEVAALLS